MNIAYNIAWLKRIAEDICEITGISINIVDTKFNSIYRCEKGNNSYCHKIQETETGRMLCHHSDIEMYKKCALEKRYVSRICHAGVRDTAVPILKNGIVAGYIMLGRVRGAVLQGDTPELRNSYEKLTYLTDTQLEAIINLLSLILFDKAIELDYDEFISLATDYIEENLAEELSVERLCHVLHVSKNTLYKAFADFYGCTVNEYVVSRRTEKAKELLRLSGDSIADISERVGYENYTYFSKLFKKRTGFTPRDYRKNSTTPNA